jgi:hypothetical protein
MQMKHTSVFDTHLPVEPKTIAAPTTATHPAIDCEESPDVRPYFASKDETISIIAIRSPATITKM